MKTRMVKHTEPMVRVMRDVRDASRDYNLPYKRVKELEAEGKLFFGLNNGQYCTTNKNDRPT